MRHFTLILGVVALTLPGAKAQDNCQQFTGTIKSGLYLVGLSGAQWHGIAEVTIGKSQPMTGTTVTINKETRGDPFDLTRAYSGREETTITLNGGGKIVLQTRFVVPARPDPKLVWWVSETGSIEPAAGANGKFEAIHGRVTIHGPFGQTVLVPKPDPLPGFSLDLGWIGEIRGNICGVN